MDMVDMAMDMVNEVASVWVFLDGVGGCCPGKWKVLIFSTISQKGVLKDCFLQE